MQLSKRPAVYALPSYSFIPLCCPHPRYNSSIDEAGVWSKAVGGE